MLLEGKKVFVTGGSRGIGKEIIMKSLSEGASIHYCGSSPGPHQEEMKSMTKGSATVTFHEVNVTDEDRVKKLVADVTSDGKLDVLVNNAGITRDGMVFRMPLEQWETVLKVNLTGAFLVAREVSAFMALKQKSGSIVNMASVVGQMGNAGQTNYSASKAGLIGFTKSLARETAKRNVRVNAIAPGFIATGMTDKLSDEIKAEYINAIPLGRIGAAEDVANAVLYLASDLSSYITGQVIRVDGGLLM